MSEGTRCVWVCDVCGYAMCDCMRCVRLCDVCWCELFVVTCVGYDVGCEVFVVSCVGCAVCGYARCGVV